MIRAFILIIFIVVAVACSNPSENLTSKQFAAVKESVKLMTDSIAKNISTQGPVAWLRYFEDSPNFFMASNGKLVFSNNDSARNFITTILVKNIRTIKLQWSDIRIDPLTNTLAGIAANFHEDITDVTGKTLPYDGYFTGIAHQTSQGWKLHNAHWSIIETR